MIGTRRNNSIARSAALNDTREGSDRYTRDKGGRNVQGTTFAFSSGSLTDSGNGLGGFTAGQLLRVRGGATGNRTYIAGTVAAGSIAFTPTAADLSAGANIDVRTV